MSNVITEKDGIEMEIIMAMLMQSAGKRIHKQKVSKDKIFMTIGSFLDKKPEFPKAFYVVDRSSDGDRLFSQSLSDIVVSPAKAIAKRLETAVIDNGILKWLCFIPIKPPRGIVAATNMPVSWFGCHYRTYTPSGKQTYIKEPMALKSNGTVARLMPLGWKGFDAEMCLSEQTQQLALSLSLFEDAVRSSAYLAIVQEHVKMMFPVGEQAYKEFFKMRDGYRETPTGRRNPIIHWCSEHLRKCGADKVSVVSAHKRGSNEFVCGPMKLTIQENEGYQAYL